MQWLPFLGRFRVATLVMASLLGCASRDQGTGPLGSANAKAEQPGEAQERSLEQRRRESPDQSAAHSGSKARLSFLSFDGTRPPRNGDGDDYPNQMTSAGRANNWIESKDAVSGSALAFRLTEGKFYPQFNPYNYAGNPGAVGPRSFARDYAPTPAQWRFDTFDRMRFWLKSPLSAFPHSTKGQCNVEFGAYVKRVNNADRYSDEAGGAHYYHLLNIPGYGEWTQVILNMHPSHSRGEPGRKDPGNQPHPTAEKEYNYYDTLTRFYLQFYGPPATYPADYLLDEFEFYAEGREENDEQVYSITGTHIAALKRVIVTWSRHKDEGSIKHEVRYAWSDIHASGWAKATPAPEGIVTPPGDGGYNSMVYDTTTLPLAGQRTVYIAIRPQNSDRFSQIAIPLTER